MAHAGTRGHACALLGSNGSESLPCEWDRARSQHAGRAASPGLATEGQKRRGPGTSSDDHEPDRRWRRSGWENDLARLCPARDARGGRAARRALSRSGLRADQGILGDPAGAIARAWRRGEGTWHPYHWSLPKFGSVRTGHRRGHELLRAPRGDRERPPARRRASTAGGREPARTVSPAAPTGSGKHPRPRGPLGPRADLELSDACRATPDDSISR